MGYAIQRVAYFAHLTTLLRIFIHLTVFVIDPGHRSFKPSAYWFSHSMSARVSPGLTFLRGGGAGTESERRRR
jgi:hypothetical protein